MESVIESLAIVPRMTGRPHRLATDNAIRDAAYSDHRSFVRSLARSQKSIVSLAPDLGTLVNFHRLQLRPRRQMHFIVSSAHVRLSLCTLSVCSDNNFGTK